MSVFSSSYLARLGAIHIWCPHFLGDFWPPLVRNLCTENLQNWGIFWPPPHPTLSMDVLCVCPPAPLYCKTWNSEIAWPTKSNNKMSTRLFHDRFASESRFLSHCAWQATSVLQVLPVCMSAVDGRMVNECGLQVLWQLEAAQPRSRYD